MANVNLVSNIDSARIISVYFAEGEEIPIPVQVMELAHFYIVVNVLTLSVE